ASPVDVWAGTGAILAANSPTYAVNAPDDPTAYIGSDNRVYHLDGTDGHVIAKTSALPGNVTQIRLVSTDNDDTPEYVYVAVKIDGTFPARAVYAFHASDLTPVEDDSDRDVWASTGVTTDLGDTRVGSDEMMYWSTLHSVSGRNQVQLSGALNRMHLSNGL